MGQRHTGHRRARLLAGQNDLALEFWRMVAPGALRWSVLHSVHLSAWWTLSSRFRLGRSRCLHRTHTEIKRLHELMHESARHRNDSPQARTAWQSACAEFHHRYDELAFPGGYEAALADLVLGNQQVIDATLSFLEVRPYFFRSGYMRKVLLRKIKQVDLTPQQLERLKGILLRQATWNAQRAEQRNA